MTRAKVLAALGVFLSIACSNKTDKRPPQGSAAGSAQTMTRQLPKEDMVAIPEGDYKTSEPVFAPDARGTCSSEILEKVAKLYHVQWPDAFSYVHAFSIDRSVTSCADYISCVRQGGCTRSGPDLHEGCLNGGVLVKLSHAVEYCEWRHMRLPTLTQWQVAFRGTTARLDAECGNATIATGDACPYRSEFGVIGHFRGPNHEFTRTLGCYPLDADEKGSQSAPVPTPVRVLTSYTALYAFFKMSADLTNQFRCVRDQGVMIP